MNSWEREDDLVFECEGDIHERTPADFAGKFNNQFPVESSLYRACVAGGPKTT